MCFQSKISVNSAPFTFFFLNFSYFYITSFTFGKNFIPLFMSSRRRLEDDIEKDLQELECADMEWIDLA